MKIEKLTKLKNDKYKITFDNGESIKTYDDVIIKNMLFDGKQIDNAILSEISVSNDYYDVYYKIVKMIGNKWRSRKEIEDYFEKNEIEENIQNKVIDNLIKNKLLDDERYARSYAADAINLRKNGPLKIESDLRNLQIDETIIFDIMKNLDYQLIHENLINIINKRNKLNNHYSLFQLKTKLKNELYNLGYEKNEIDESLNNLLKENNEIAKKEYDKLYKKYSKKYSDNELKYRIKQAMYQKGFNYDGE